MKLVHHILALALGASLTASCLEGCSAADRKVEAGVGQVGVGVADAVCLAKVPKEYSYVCDLGETAVDDLIKAIALSAPAVTPMVARVSLATLDIHAKRVLLADLVEKSKGPAADAGAK